MSNEEHSFLIGATHAFVTSIPYGMAQLAGHAFMSNGITPESFVKYRDLIWGTSPESVLGTNGSIPFVESLAGFFLLGAYLYKTSADILPNSLKGILIHEIFRAIEGIYVLATPALIATALIQHEPLVALGIAAATTTRLLWPTHKKDERESTIPSSNSRLPPPDSSVEGYRSPVEESLRNIQAEVDLELLDEPYISEVKAVISVLQRESHRTKPGIVANLISCLLDRAEKRRDREEMDRMKGL